MRLVDLLAVEGLVAGKRVNDARVRPASSQVDALPPIWAPTLGLLGASTLSPGAVDRLVALLFLLLAGRLLPR